MSTSRFARSFERALHHGWAYERENSFGIVLKRKAVRIRLLWSGRMYASILDIHCSL
jgi:hypothetical protein